MMHDQNISLLLPWYANGTLSIADRELVDRELGSCPECAAELADLQRLEGAFSQMTVDEPPYAVYARVLTRIEDRGSRGVVSLRDRAFRLFERLRSWKVLVPAAALLVLALFVVDRAGQFSTRTYAGPELPAGSAGDLQTLERIAAPVPAPAHVIVPKEPPPKAQPTAGPQLARTGAISLIVSDVDAALRASTSIATRFGGNVKSLTDGGWSGIERRGAQLEISVPSKSFDSALADLAMLGKVTSKAIQAEDVSDQLVDGKARLNNLRHEEADLVRIMDRSGKVSDILEVEQQLASVREQIERLDAELRSTSSRVVYSTISIDMTTERSQPIIDRGPLSQLEDTWTRAFHAAFQTFIGLIGAGIWLLAYVPFALAAAAVAYGMYRWAKSRFGD